MLPNLSVYTEAARLRRVADYLDSLGGCSEAP